VRIEGASEIEQDERGNIALLSKESIKHKGNTFRLRGEDSEASSFIFIGF